MTNQADDEARSYRDAQPITRIQVLEGGLLRMAGHKEVQSRGDCYEYVGTVWDRSPADLADAMRECPPLAWEVHSIYSDFRGGLQDVLAAADDAGLSHLEEVAALKVRFDDLPDEPEVGVERWLAAVGDSYFKDKVVSRIENWFSEPPDWSAEDDYLPEAATSQGAALEFFRGLDAEVLDRLGVLLIEGDRPGSTYYAAELRNDIDAANTASKAAGLYVHFANAQSDFIEGIEKILSEPPGVGQFSERCVLPSGVHVRHTFSQASGFAATFKTAAYKARFGDPPSWLECCHPSHRSRLCQLALECQMPLPDSSPCELMYEAS